MSVLAGSVALGYFVIAAVVAPKIKMPTANSLCVKVVRGAAIAFFMGCGMTHVHILVHTVGYGVPQPVELHELVFHGAQAVGAWMFIVGAILRFELQIVPAATRQELKTAVEVHRGLADEAERIAGRDELTGLARRWRFDEELGRQVENSSRHGRLGALIIIDVDGLKGVNDAAGHQAGDRVLRHVADQMQRELRSTDIAARIGGDEFAIILTEAGMEEAESVAQRLVTSLHTSSTVDVPETSASLGVIAIDGFMSPTDLVARADFAMYDAKRAGGDRWVRAEALVA